LAAFLGRVPRWLGALVTIACTAWTMALFIAASRLNLNQYQTPSELLAAFRTAAADPQWHTPLGFTPPHLRMDVFIAACVTLVVLAILYVAARRAPVAVAAAYFAAMSAFYAWCGAHPKHDALSRGLLARPMPSGAALDTRTLLLYEAEYMERTGRLAEAGKARSEAARIEP
jgi:hypothetical protein